MDSTIQSLETEKYYKMKRNKIDFIEVLYYIFIIICIVSAISSFVFQTKYLLITGISSLGIVTIKQVMKK